MRCSSQPLKAIGLASPTDSIHAPVGANRWGNWQRTAIAVAVALFVGGGMMSCATAQEPRRSPFNDPIDIGDREWNRTLSDARTRLSREILRDVLERLSEGSVRTLEAIERLYRIPTERLRERIAEEYERIADDTAGGPGNGNVSRADGSRRSGHFSGSTRAGNASEQAATPLSAADLERMREERAWQQYRERLGDLSPRELAQAYMDYQARRLDALLPQENTPRPDVLDLARQQAASQLPAPSNPSPDLPPPYNPPSVGPQSDATEYAPSEGIGFNDNASHDDPIYVRATRRAPSAAERYNQFVATYLRQPGVSPSARPATTPSYASRENRTYPGNGRSQPIGQGSDVVSVRERTSNTGAAPSTPAPRPTIGFDNSQPRNAPSVSMPAVTPRQAGVASQTAGLDFVQ